MQRVIFETVLFPTRTQYIMCFQFQFPNFFCILRLSQMRTSHNTMSPTKNLLTPNCWCKNQSFVHAPAHMQFLLQCTSFGIKNKSCYLIRWLKQAVLPALHFLPGNYFIQKVMTPSWIFSRAVHLSASFVSVGVCFYHWDQYSLFLRIFHQAYLSKSTSDFRFLFTRAHAET